MEAYRFGGRRGYPSHIVVAVHRLTLAFALLMASCSGTQEPASVSIPPEAVPVGAEALVTPELVAVAGLQPGDELFSLSAGEGSVLVRVRPGEPTLLFGTSCDVVSASPLPDGWQGVCLEYTSHGQRILGTFPYGTTSQNGLPRAWSPPEPPSEWASGITVGEIPPGYNFGWNEGHETATFHVFVAQDGASQFAVGRQRTSEPWPVEGYEVTLSGRVFTITPEVRILEEVGAGVRIEVVSQSLDQDVLLLIAQSIRYDPERDG
jgi:hypothetical protein